MRTILKGVEPASLTEYRSAPGTGYDGYRDKDTLRAHLVKEQRGLCCYCLSRIRAERDSTKVEHLALPGQLPRRSSLIPPTGDYPLTVGTPKQYARGRWARRYSVPNRLPFYVWERSMPRIHDIYIDCAVYIYGSLSDAKAGERTGGSGFIVSVPVALDPAKGVWLYVVTNRHVVLKAGTPVVRVNRIDGTPEYHETDKTHWYMHEDGDDIAVSPFQADFDNLKFITLLLSNFVTLKLVSDEDIGIGDDTFMIGRFINREGRQLNTPAVRFGNIAMMPNERIISPHGIAQESFLVEVRSLPGYSGSAVFIYSPCAMNDMSVRRFGKSKVNYGGLNMDPATAEAFFAPMKPKGPYLLGIDWCHIPRRTSIMDRDGKPVAEGWYIEENTGMAGVIPAWKIAEVLNCEELSNMRKEWEENLSKNADQMVLDSAEADPEVFTREAFENALRKVSKKMGPSPPVEGK
jgi:hypothetical protein